MKGRDFAYIINKIRDEGFDYALIEFANEIQDKPFQTLRKQYLNAREALIEYLGLEPEDTNERNNS